MFVNLPDTLFSFYHTVKQAHTLTLKAMRLPQLHESLRHRHGTRAPSGPRHPGLSHAEVHEGLITAGVKTQGPAQSSVGDPAGALGTPCCAPGTRWAS